MNVLSYATPRHTRAFTSEISQPSVSVLVLVSQSAVGLAQLYEELLVSLEGVCEGLEIVFVVEPPLNQATAPLVSFIQRGDPIRIVQVGQARGEASLLRVGAQHCRGSIILTVPSSRRVETRSLATLVNAVQNGADMAVARRWPRRDSRFMQAQTWLFHTIAGRLVGGAPRAVNDVACGVRAFRRDVLDRIPLYGDLALFLPLLAVRDGYAVTEIGLPQHPDNRRTRFHSPGLYVRRLFDLLGLFFLVRFTEKPLRFFGVLGSAVALPGAAILATVFVQKLAGQGLADRPLLLLGLLLFVLGIQSIALGLVGEIIVHLNAPQRASYRLNADVPRLPAD